MKTTLAILALALVACTATIPEGRFVCATDRDCPPLWYCHSDALCYSRAEPDGGGERDAAELLVDAGVALPDSGVDAGALEPDAGADTGVPTLIDAGSDAGCDAGATPACPTVTGLACVEDIDCYTTMPCMPWHSCAGTCRMGRCL